MLAFDAVSQENQGVLNTGGEVDESQRKNLIFRLGGVGFLLDLASVVEVIDHAERLLDANRSVLSRGIVTALFFRQTWIPVVDPAMKLGLEERSGLENRIIIVLHGSEGNWAVLVDKVEKVAETIDPQLCAIPDLLKVSAFDCYSQVRLINSIPYVVFEPERFYGADVAAL